MLRALLILLLSGARAVAAEEEIVDWQDAARCVGRVCSIRGTVVEAEDDGPSTRLYFDAERRDMRVLLMRGWLVTWPSYVGHEIIATGKVDRFRDHVEMILLAPGDITVVGGLPSPTPSAEATLTAPPPLTETPTALPPLTETPTVPPPDTPTIAAPSTSTKAPPPTSVPAPTQPAAEVDELRKRVRELEDRVRELEGQ